MNKLITKIVGVALGLSMAVGAGVAIAANSSSNMTLAEATSAEWQLVTAAPSDWSGEYILASGSSGSVKIFDGSSYSGADSCAGVSATVSSSKITADTADALTIAKSSTNGKYTVSVNGKYIGKNANSNGIDSNSTWSTNLDNDITYSGGKVVIKGNGGRVLTWYSSNSNFKYYASSNNCSQLFKKVASYTISFNANGGTGTVPSNITGSGSKTLPSSANLTKTGYTLDGWGDISHKDNASAQYALGAAYTLSADITLYAHWTINKYSVSASITNGGFSGTTGANAATHGTAYNATITANANYNLPENLTVTMGGAATNAYTYNSSTGAFSIATPTGDISISGECTPNATEYIITTTVTNGSYSGDTSIYSGFTASITFTPNDHYKLPTESSAFEVEHAEIQSYNSSTGILVLENPDDDVSVSVSMVAKAQNTISMGTLTGVSQANGNPTSVEEGASVTLTFTADDGYGLPTDSGVTVTGTGSSFIWTQGTGKLQITGGTGNITVSIVGIVRTLISITISSNSGSYTLGDAFVMPTVTAVYNVGGNEEVTAQATATGDGLVNGVLTKAGSKTITISYGGQSASYTATVTAVVPSAGGVAKVTNIADLTVDSTVYLVCEGRSKQFNGINTSGGTHYGNGTDYSTSIATATYPLTIVAGYSEGTIAFKTGNNYLYWNSGNSLDTNSTLSNKTSWTVSISSGNATILNKNDNTRQIMWNYSSPRFACYSGQTPTYDAAQGYNMVQIYKNYPAVVKSLKWITAEVKSGTYYQGSDVTASDFTVTAHYDDGTTSTPTSDITVTNGTLNNIGSNTVTLTYSGKSCNVTVTAVEQTATLTGLTWAQGELNIIDGQNIDFSKLGTITAEYDDGDSYASKSIGACSVATYTKTNDVYTKVSDLDDGDTITSSSHGKYLGVTYTETNTYTAYSSAPIYVVERMNEVFVQEETFTWTKLTSLSIGDNVVIAGTKADNTSPYELTGVPVDIGVATAFSDTDPSGTYILTVVEGSEEGQVAFKDSNNNYLSYTTDKKLGLSTEVDANSSWTVSFDNEDPTKATVINIASESPLQYNPGSRFCVYASASQQPVQFYKGTAGYEPVGGDIANTNVIAQKAVLKFAQEFLDATSEICDMDGNTDLSTWATTIKATYTSNRPAETGANQDHFDDLIKYAYKAERNAQGLTPTGDTLQKALARYDWILQHHNNVEDFLHLTSGRPEPINPKTTNSLLFVNQQAVVITSVVISIIGMSALCGYFLLRKKKEEK